MEDFNPQERAIYDFLSSRQNAPQPVVSKPSPKQAQQPKKPGTGSFLLGLLPGGSLVDKKIRGEQITGGDVALEAALTALPFGIGKVGRAAVAGVKGVKAAINSARSGSKASDILSSAKTASQVAEPKSVGVFSRGLLRQSTIAPNSTLKTAGEQNKLIELSRSLPELRGSASRKFQNVEGAIAKKTGQVDEILGGITDRKSFSDLDQRARQLHDMIPDAAEQKRFANEFQTIVNNTFKGSVPTNLSATDINKLRRGVNSQLSSTFKKIEAGTQLTDKDEALLKLRDVFSGSLEDIAPEAVRGQVKGLNRDISTLMSGIPEFKRASEDALQLLGTRIPFVSKTIPQMFQSGADILGRTATNPITRGVGAQAGVRLGADILGLREPQGINTTPSTASSILDTTGAETSSQPSQAQLIAQLMQLSGQGTGRTAYSRESAAKDIQADLAKTGGANMDKIMQLYEFLNPEPKADKTSESTAKQQSAQAALSETEKLFESAGGGQGLPGYFQRLLGRGRVNPEVEAYDKLRKTSAVPIARAFGETGPLSDLDVETYVNALPDVSDSPQAAAIKIESLRRRLAATNSASSPASEILASYGY